MGEIWLTSDLHFNHNREFIFKPRGFDNVYDMNRTIIKNWNSTVSDEDNIYILGDLCLGGASSLNENKSLIQSLRGKLHIIIGNHDTNSRIDMYGSCYNVYEIEAATYLKYKKYHFFLSHFPSFTANIEKESLKQCTCNLFGHTHQQTNFYNDFPFMYHVGVDSHNCTPVNIEQAIEEMEKKAQECNQL